MDVLSVFVFILACWSTQVHSAITIEAPDAISIPEDQIDPGGVLTKFNLTGSSGPVQFSIMNDYFTIDTQKVAVVLKFEPLNYEAMVTKTIEVAFSARDSSGSDEHTILVTVTDGNDAPSFAGYDVDRGGFVLSVYASPGHVVGIVTATDEDQTSPNNEFTYAIGTPDTPFSITADGRLKLNPDTSQWSHVQRRDKNVWPVVVQAIDNGVPPKTGTITVPIAICDLAFVED